METSKAGKNKIGSDALFSLLHVRKRGIVGHVASSLQIEIGVWWLDRGGEFLNHSRQQTQYLNKSKHNSERIMA